jgi:hypothetical protein
MMKKLLIFDFVPVSVLPSTVTKIGAIDSCMIGENSIAIYLTLTIFEVNFLSVNHFPFR